MIKLLSLFGAATVLAGCASSQAPMNELSENYEYSPEKSLALNVTQAAGIEGLTDLPREEYEALVEKHPELRGIDPRQANAPGGPGKLLGAGVAGVAGALDPIQQIGSLGTGFIDAAFWLSGDDRSVSQKNYLIFWLPKGKDLKDVEREIAESYYRAATGYEDEVEVAFKNSLLSIDAATAGPPTCITAEYKESNYDCSFKITSAFYTLDPNSDGFTRDNFELPEAGSAPEYVGDSAALRGPIIAQITGASYPDDLDLDYQKISKSLTDYLGEHYFKYYTASAEGYVTPRVYHEGEAYFFIEP